METPPLVSLLSRPVVLRSANVLIREHGDEAPIHSAMRHDELLDAGHLDGRRVWKRMHKAALWLIIRVIEELLSKERPEGASLH